MERRSRYTIGMSERIDKIIAEALDLPAPLTAFIAANLLESLDIDGDQELSDEWKAEISKRCREIDERAVHLVEADEVFAKAHSKLP
ncbi:MAG: addiction module protein [Sedimentisphaerales bacterium]|nr:addiction module protein [Sedimentisphaerales bacterium]